MKKNERGNRMKDKIINIGLRLALFTAFVFVAWGAAIMLDKLVKLAETALGVR